MKIDFLGSYRDVSKVLEPISRAKLTSGTSPEFGALLSSISPNPAEKSELNSTSYVPSKVGSPPAQKPEDHGPMARFSFSEPTLQAPSIGRLTIAEPPKDIVKEAVKEPSAPSVKTPTILSAKRVEVRTENLPQNAPQKEIAIKDVRSLVEDAGKRHGIDPALSMAVIAQESSFNPKAVSQDGHSSKGLFQLLDKTGRQLHENQDQEGPYDPFNPEMNIDLGVGYLRRLHELFTKDAVLPNNVSTRAAANFSSLEKLAVAAFNAGEGRVASAQERALKDGKDPALYEAVAPYLPDTTQEYVTRIMAAKHQFETQSAG